MKNKRHINNFDIIRLLLALTVVLFHSGVLYDINCLKSFAGGTAVESFFIISGYLIFASWERSKNLKDFCIKRFKRIAPALYFLIFLCLLGGIFLTNLTLLEYIKSTSLYRYVIANLNFLNFLGQSLPGVFANNEDNAVNGALWTLKVEIIFYSFVPLMYFFFKRNVIKGLIFAIIITRIFNYFCLKYNTFFIAHFGEIVTKILFDSTRSPLCNSTFFFMGGLLYKLKDKIEKFKILKSYFTIPIFITIAVLYKYKNINPFINPIILSFLVIYFALYCPLRIKIPQKIGDLSYGIYIYHCPIIQTFINFNLPSRIGNTNVVGLTVVIVISLAYFSWHFIEKRFLLKK